MRAVYRVSLCWVPELHDRLLAPLLPTRLSTDRLLWRVCRQMLRRAFRYDWRLWTVPELREMLLAAGFHDVRAWLRPMKARASKIALLQTRPPPPRCMPWHGNPAVRHARLLKKPKCPVSTPALPCMSSPPATFRQSSL